MVRGWQAECTSTGFTQEASFSRKNCFCFVSVRQTIRTDARRLKHARPCAACRAAHRPGVLLRDLRAYTRFMRESGAGIRRYDSTAPTGDGSDRSVISVRVGSVCHTCKEESLSAFAGRDSSFENKLRGADISAAEGRKPAPVDAFKRTRRG